MSFSSRNFSRIGPPELIKTYMSKGFEVELYECSAGYFVMCTDLREGSHGQAYKFTTCRENRSQVELDFKQCILELELKGY